MDQAPLILMNEPPLMFQPSIAARYGLSVAVFVQQIHYWLYINERSESKKPVGERPHFRESRWWTYNSYAQWQEEFYFWSEDAIKRIAQKAEEAGILTSKQFEVATYDRRKWYTVNYETLGNPDGGKFVPSMGANSPVPTGQNRPVYTKQETTTETTTSAGKEPAGVPLVENDVWAGIPPQELTVPDGGNKARKEIYVERCDQCQVDITQEMDACKACGRPVHWTGSYIADLRYKRAKHKRVDEELVARRAAELRLSEPLRFLLACARSSPASYKSYFLKGQAEALEALVEAYGGQIVKDKANEFKANGEQGGGLIKHVLAFLQQYNPNIAKRHSANAIITDPEELGRQNDAWLIAHGRKSEPDGDNQSVSPISPDEPSEPDDDMFAWANEK